jgi:multiple sugar transport system ATP-binding protein
VVLDIAGEPRIACSTPVETGRKVLAGMRPEHLHVARDDADGFELPVTMMESTGSLTYIVLGTDPEVTLVEQGRERVRPGDKLKLTIEPGLVHLFDQETGKRI